eukprot:TRINITY_DN3459_c0_g1_i1.p1 TRINITY_DN3459_c0_g1~~TRINITY_DN3459_c0_g1_i1.p1  ORF type:complete len:173 (-),score=54.50 TRINITY_DN3459_c0_g1_i1:145-600(-)
MAETKKSFRRSLSLASLPFSSPSTEPSNGSTSQEKKSLKTPSVGSLPRESLDTNFFDHATKKPSTPAVVVSKPSSAPNLPNKTADNSANAKKTSTTSSFLAKALGKGTNSREVTKRTVSEKKTAAPAPLFSSGFANSLKNEDENRRKSVKF